jgi:hypothetical protein
MRVFGLLGMVVAFALGTLAVAGFAWGAFLGSIVTEDDPMPYEVSSTLVLIVSVAAAVAAGFLWRLCLAWVAPRADAGETAALVVAVVFYGLLAVLVVLVVLRVVGVTGPIITEQGI